MIETLNAIDTKLFFALNSLAGNEVFDNINIYLSSKTFWLYIFILFSAFILYKHKKDGLKLLGFLILTVSFTDAFTYNVLKQNIERVRPCVEYKGEVATPTGCKSMFGFPSNHAANSAAFASTVVFLGYKAIGYGFAGIAFLVGLSRVFLGVHYPGDVFFGFITGTLYSFLLIKAVNLLVNKLKKSEQN